MSLTFVGSLIVIAALLAFFISRGRRGWYLLGVAVVLIAIGMVADQAASNAVWRALPFSAHDQAWLFSMAGFTGVGGVIGLSIRGALSLLPKKG